MTKEMESGGRIHQFYRQCNRCNTVFAYNMYLCPECRCPEFRMIKREDEDDTERNPSPSDGDDGAGA